MGKRIFQRGDHLRFVSVVDFARLFTIQPRRRGRAHEFVEVVVGGADMQQNLPKRAHVSRWGVRYTSLPVASSGFC
jgi:hypothetical protein